MNSYDKCLKKMPKDVRNAIERIVLNSTVKDWICTFDGVDLDILESAGREIVRLEKELYDARTTYL